jgi:MYXO-CTERM domain-containing protein
VTEIRITNTGPGPLGLDAIEAVHPALTGSNHAIEFRIFRKRQDDSKRFQLRLKNIAPLDGGTSLEGFRVAHYGNLVIDETRHPLRARDGQITSTADTDAGDDDQSWVPYTDYVWSGFGVGLAPGDIASHEGWQTIDLDTPPEDWLEDFIFTLRWPDLEGDVTTMPPNAQAIGKMFALFEFPPHPVSVSEPRPAYYQEITNAPLVPEAACTDCALEVDENGNPVTGCSCTTSTVTGSRSLAPLWLLAVLAWAISRRSAVRVSGR